MFQTIADSIGFPVDQVRYIVLLFLCYPLALVFRHLLHPSTTPLITRQLFSISFGLLFGFLCFGMSQMGILFGIAGVSYGLLLVVPATTIQRYSMVWAMGSMSAAHIYRMATDYGGWHLDFTGPLMVMVQKITLLGYALHDGKARKDSELNEDQRIQKIDTCPSVLEFFTYMFNFHSLLAGPTCTIKEFLSFMDGSNLKPLDNPNQYAQAKSHVNEPSAAYPIISKLIVAILSMVVHVFLSQQCSQDMLTDPQYSFVERFFIVLLYGMRVRTRYYFVWMLVDSISNTCGLGFSGYDKTGSPKWDLVTNIDILGLEFACNMRAISSNWNITTGLWLRRVCYERVAVGISPTVMTYCLSAWWHGFYPGYYLSFVFIAIATEAARKMRRLLRHHFQSSLGMKWFYNFLTCFSARFCLGYGIMPFDLMWVTPGLIFWGYAYYIPHIVLLVVVFLFPSGKSPRPTKDKAEKPTESKAD